MSRGVSEFCCSDLHAMVPLKATDVRTIRHIILLLASFIPCVSHAQPQEPKFDQFKVTSIYKGPTRLPDFQRRDRQFADFRTRLRDGLKAGPNFAGHYSVVQFGCGTGCSRVYLADNRTGKVFEFPRGGEDNQHLDLSFKLDSRMLVAQWSSGFGDNDQCVLEYLIWERDEAKPLATKTLGAADVCLSRSASDPLPAVSPESPAAAAESIKLKKPIQGFYRLPLKDTYGNEAGCSAAAGGDLSNDAMAYISEEEYRQHESSCRFVAIYQANSDFLAHDSRAWTIIASCGVEGEAHSRLLTAQEVDDSVTITEGDKEPISLARCR
jgi:hypothetical protein